MTFRNGWVALGAVAAIACLFGGDPASAQPPAVVDSTPPPPRVTSKFTRPGEEVDRFELGAGVVQGFFDAVGSVGYRRSLGMPLRFDRSIMAEVTGTAKDQLTEGTLSAYFLLRPLVTYRESWRIRPLVEGGSGAHLVVQAASLEGLDRTRYKAHVYLKVHAYLGFEALVTNRVGFLARGRVSAPSHRPADYAQAAIFFR